MNRFQLSKRARASQASRSWSRDNLAAYAQCRNGNRPLSGRNGNRPLTKHSLLYLDVCFTSQAYSLMQELRQRVPSVNMSFYVNIRTIEVIHKALDIPLERGVQHKVITNGAGGSEDEGEILDEAVEEDLQNGFD